MPLAPGEVFAGYTITRTLGAGGMGEVYLAKHPRLPREDALKVLTGDLSGDASFRERFSREAELIAKMWHPHIVGVHDRGEFDGRLWIAMDFVDGIDAGRLLKERYPTGVPPSLVTDIVVAVAAALDYAHKRGVLHRDVKPHNIMLSNMDVDGEFRILLADFGIARPVDDKQFLTSTNMTLGTVAYAAPEQLMGEQVDGRADQYALAATAYHLLTGSVPFPNSNPAVVITLHLNSPPPPLAGTRPELAALDEVMRAALAKDPADRFPRCGDFARAFAEHATLERSVSSTAATALATMPARTITGGGADQQETVLSQVQRHRREGRRYIILAVVLLVAIGAAALSFFLRPHAPHAATAGKSPTAQQFSPAPPAAKPPPSGPVQSSAPQDQVEPRDLAAATAAAQEKANRHLAGDFAAEWLLFTNTVRDGITQQDYVHYSQVCNPAGKGPITVTGVRMNGPDRAIVRIGLAAVTRQRTMVYESGVWHEVPDEFLLSNLGMTGDQLIAADKQRGHCQG